MKKTRQSGRSRQKLAAALLALMETAPFDAITITAITKAAGVARLTFYRHFESKEEVLLAHFETAFNRYFAEAAQSGNMDFREALCHCFAYWRKEEGAARLLIGHGLQGLLHHTLGDCLRRALAACALPRGLNGFQQRFIEGGLLLVLLDWLEDPEAPAPEEMAAMLLAIVAAGEPPASA